MRNRQKLLHKQTSDTPNGVGGWSPHRPSWCYYRSDLILPSYKYKPLSSIDHPFSPARCKQSKRVLEHFWNFEVATLTHSALRKSLIFNQINFPSFLHFCQFCTQIPSWSRSHWAPWSIMHCLIKPDQGSGRWLKAGEVREGNKLSSPTD